jgi:methanogenic corrinoid protein MtbC1
VIVVLIEQAQGGPKLTDVLDEISSRLANLDGPEKVRSLVDKALSQNISVPDVVEKGLRSGLQQVGAKYEAGEYFLAELLFAASILDEVMQFLKPKLDAAAIEKKGTILLGTVRGDMHDIGKNIFKMMAVAAGFEVNDLDVDVDPELFVQESKRTEPEILGLSCLLTTALPEIKVLIDMLNESKIRAQVKVLIGGNAVTEEFAREVGADAAALNAVEGVDFCRDLVKP